MAEKYPALRAFIIEVPFDALTKVTDVTVAQGETRALLAERDALLAILKRFSAEIDEKGNIVLLVKAEIASEISRIVREAEGGK